MNAHGRRAGRRLKRRAFAAHRPRRCRVAASRSLPCPRRPAPYPRRKDRDSSYVIPIAADLPRRHSPYLENKCSSLSMPSAADLSRPFQRPPGNSRFAWFLPAFEVIQRVEIAESPVKRAFRGVCPHPFYSSLSLSFVWCHLPCAPELARSLTRRRRKNAHQCGIVRTPLENPTLPLTSFMPHLISL